MAAFSTIALASLAAGQTISQFATQRAQAGVLDAQGAYAQGTAERNARLAELQGADAIARGREAETRQRTRTRQTIGAQRAALAAQGIVIDDGSALDVQQDTAALGELDALTIRNNARREAWGFRVQAMDQRTQGAFAAASARNQARALRTQSVGTLLTGAANLGALGYSQGFGSGPRAPRQTDKSFAKGG